MSIIKWLIHLLVAAFLSLISQVGGVIYVLSFLTFPLFKKYSDGPLRRPIFKFFNFILLYSIFTFLIIPPIAKKFGRVPLPVFETSHVQPLSFLTCFLNRHYVRPGLYSITLDIGDKLHREFPGATLLYMDANFPFINGYPLLPHKGHNDGKKLDIAFCYILKENGQPTNDYPAYIGYGICEGPLRGEYDQPRICNSKNKYYSLVNKYMPKGDKDLYLFDIKSTRFLVNSFVKEPSIKKVFIEPHLKTRLKLSDYKVRFHGCRSVRHDDHVHVEIK